MLKNCRYQNLYLLKSIYPDSRKFFWQKSVHIRTCCCIAVQDPLYLSPLTTCNRNVETLVQRHSCLRSLTSWAKCLRNAPCQCTAHATASADIGLFKSESVPRTGIFSPNKHEISIRSRKPEGYRLRYYILRFAGRLSWSITFRLVFSLLNLHYWMNTLWSQKKLLTAMFSGKQGVPEQVH